MATSLHPITNWPQYNKSLINRGSLTFWVDAEAMSNWFHHDHHGRRGRCQLYTDQTICTFLMLKGIFNLTLRATQGLLDSLFELMNVPLCAPDYSCVSKRARTVTVAYRQPSKGRHSNELGYWYPTLLLYPFSLSVLDLQFGILLYFCMSAF